LVRGQIRRYLTKAQWDYPELSWKECKSLFESDFRVEGPEKVLRAILADLKEQTK
jgi:hypothetical protein